MSYSCMEPGPVASDVVPRGHQRRAARAQDLHCRRPRFAARLVRLRELEELPSVRWPLGGSPMALASLQRTDHLGEIVIDSPPQNLYSAQLLADLRAAVDEAADSDIRALLLRAEGDDFSAGAELTVFIGIDEAQARELSSTVLSLIEAIEDLPVRPSHSSTASATRARPRPSLRSILS